MGIWKEDCKLFCPALTMWYHKFPVQKCYFATFWWLYPDLYKTCKDSSEVLCNKQIFEGRRNMAGLVPIKLAGPCSWFRNGVRAVEAVGWWGRGGIELRWMSKNVLSAVASFLGKVGGAFSHQQLRLAMVVPSSNLEDRLACSISETLSIIFHQLHPNWIQTAPRGNTYDIY